MQFDGFDQSGLEVAEIRTVEMGKEAKLQMLHEGFKSRFTDEYKNYLGLNETAQDGLAMWIGENAALTAEAIPDAMDIIDAMYKGMDSYDIHTMGILEISDWDIHPEFKYQCIKQHAGYAAEVISTAKENLIALRDGTGIITQRADDRPDLFPRNDQYVDKIRIDSRTHEIIERVQTKFVGKNPEECFKKLMSKKFDKYFVEDKVDKVEIPKDYYKRVMKLAKDEIADVERQIERLKADGNEKALATRQARLERLKCVVSKIEKSTVSNFEAKLAVEHPKAYQRLVMTNQCSLVGFESGLGAAGLTAAVSTVDNINKYLDGEITVNEAVKDIAKDTGAAGAVGFGTGFVTHAVAASMNGSSHQLIKAVGGSCAPAVVVSWGVQSFDAAVDFAQGDINASELAYELGKNAADVAGGVVGGAVGGAVGAAAGAKAGALAGAAVGSIVPGAGTAVGAGVGATVGTGVGLVGIMVGCAIASEAYATAVEYGGKGAEVMADKAQEMADKTIEIAKAEVPEKVDFIKESINSFASENGVPVRV